MIYCPLLRPSSVIQVLPRRTQEGGDLGRTGSRKGSVCFSRHGSGSGHGADTPRRAPGAGQCLCGKGDVCFKRCNTGDSHTGKQTPPVTIPSFPSAHLDLAMSGHTLSFVHISLIYIQAKQGAISAREAVLGWGQGRRILATDESKVYTYHIDVLIYTGPI